MLKKWIFYSSLTLIIAYLSSGFKPSDSQNHNGFQSSNQKEMSYLFPSQEEQDYANLNVPFTGKFSKNHKENTTKSIHWVIWVNTNLVLKH